MNVQYLQKGNSIHMPTPYKRVGERMKGSNI